MKNYMNQLKKKFYKFAYSNRNPIYKLCTRKKTLSHIFGNAYEITCGEKHFNVQYEKGIGGIIFDIHGGGYFFGSHMDENHFCHFMHEKTGMTVVSCYYDLSSESRYPTQIEQIYRTIMTFCEDTGIDTERIFVMGHSAGGNATATVTLLSQERKEFHVDGEILVYPVLDLACEPKERPKVDGNTLPNSMMEFFNDMYFENKEDAKEPYASPLLASDEGLKKLPPTYILTCAKDNLRTDGIKYSERLKKVGVKVHQMEVNEVHGFLESGMYDYYGKSKKESAVAAEEAEKIAQWINTLM